MYPNMAVNSARRSYHTIDFSSRINSANPHQLVSILFDELLLALDAMPIARRGRMHAQYASRQARALTIIHGLDSALDFEAGPDIANSLAAVYREVRRLILVASKDGSTEQIIDARALVAEIADAWRAIA
jgi:flagellar secretion chaperone FliS